MARPPDSPGPQAHNRVFAEVVRDDYGSLLDVARSVLSPAGMSRLLRRWCSFSWHDVGLLRWLPTYSRSKLMNDAMAAAVVCVVLIPQSLAYAVLAGLDPIYGLYSSTIPLLVYAIFTTSSQVAVGPVAPTAILMESMIRAVISAPPRSPAFTHAHIALAFLSGVMQLILAVCRFGWVASLLSWPVMSGFSTAAAIIIIVSQLPDLLAMRVQREATFAMRSVRVGQAVLEGGIHWPTAAIGLLSLLTLLYAKEVSIRGVKLHPRTPVPLIVVLVTVILSAAADLPAHGIAAVGDIPSALPAPSVPITDMSDVYTLAQSAGVLALINYVQTVTLAVMFGKRKHEEVCPGSELIALGMSSCVGSFFSCHTVAGSFTRTAIQSEAGAVTPMATALTAGLMIVCILTLTRVFRYLPVAVLAAIVLASAKPLISTSDMKLLWRTRSSDCAQLFVTLIAVLLFDLSNGLLIGVAFSLLLLLYRSFRPRLMELGRLPGTDVFVAVERYPETRPVPGVVVLRLDGELHFGNVAVVCVKLQSLLAHALTARQVAAATAAASLSPGADTSPIEAGNATGAVAATAAPPENGHAPVTVRAAAAPAPPAAATGAVQRSGRGGWAELRDGDGQGDDPAHRARTRLVYALATIPEESAIRRQRGSAARPASVAPIVQATTPTRASAAPRGPTASPDTPARVLSDASDAAVVSTVACAMARTLSRTHFNDMSVERAATDSTTARVVDVCPADVREAAASHRLRAVILDASRVVDIDATACRELQGVMESYAKATVTSETRSHGRIQLLIAGLPGPVRDTLDRFGFDKATDPACTSFLTVAAAIASLYERDRESNWETITVDLSQQSNAAQGAATAASAAAAGSTGGRTSPAISRTHSGHAVSAAVAVSTPNSGRVSPAVFAFKALREGSQGDLPAAAAAPEMRLDVPSPGI